MANAQFLSKASKSLVLLITHCIERLLVTQHMGGFMLQAANLLSLSDTKALNFCS